MSADTEMPSPFASSQLNNEQDALVRRNYSMLKSPIVYIHEDTNDSTITAVESNISEKPNCKDMRQCDNEIQQQQTGSDEQRCTSKQCDERSLPKVTDDLDTNLITDKLDDWYLDMRKSLLHRLDTMRLQYLEKIQRTILQEKDTQAQIFNGLNHDIKVMRDMLIQYKHTVEQKGEIEKNLQRALDIHSKKTNAYRYYYKWRIAYTEKKQEDYVLLLTKHFYEQKLKRKVLHNWNYWMKRNRKKHVEFSSENDPNVIDDDFIQDYEMKCARLEVQLLRANEEIARLKFNKNSKDKPVRQAFLRGVCALNIEALSVLLKDERAISTTTTNHETLRPNELQ